MAQNDKYFFDYFFKINSNFKSNYNQFMNQINFYSPFLLAISETSKLGVIEFLKVHAFLFLIFLKHSKFYLK